MPRFSFKKAVSFRVYPVSFLTIITYISLLSALLWVHLVPPSVAPASELDSWGVNLDEAWQDLRVLTEKFRPYNSRRNDEVRTYMLGRIVDILKKNYAEGYDGKVEVVDDDETNVIFAGESSAGLTVRWLSGAGTADADGSRYRSTLRGQTLWFTFTARMPR